MPNIGPAELIVILLVALLVFGPRKLPELGKSIGSGLREFRRHTSGLTDELRGLSDPAPRVPAVPAPTPVVVPVAADAVAPEKPHSA